MKEISEGKVLKESKEVIEDRTNKLKLLKNDEIKKLIPLIIRHELQDEIQKYWPILESMVANIYNVECNNQS